jgi:hypothetical protein
MIRYEVPRKAHVTLTVYNTLGQKISTLIDKTMGAGSYKVRWEAGNFNSGIYLYRLQAGDVTRTKSMILVK